MLSERIDRDCVMRSDYAGTLGEDATRKIKQEHTRGDDKLDAIKQVHAGRKLPHKAGMVQHNG